MAAPSVRLAGDRLQWLAARALQGSGAPEADARDAAEILVLADLFGIATHGVERIPAYVERIGLGGIKAAPAVTVNRVAPSLLMVDGDDGLGPLVGQRALRAAMDAAREAGVGMAFVRRSNHFGPITPYAWLAAQGGFASLIASNATTTIAPWGGSEARLGNNPMGMGAPNPIGDPLILDMAMSVVARAKIRHAAKAGESIPPTWATDAQGRATTDPAEALEGFLSPIGGYKGYGLAVMIDLFAGLLSGAAFLTHVSSWSQTPGAPQNLGHVFLVVDVARLGPDTGLGAAMADFAAILKQTPAIDAQRPVLLPGEIEMSKFHRHRRDGVDLPAALVAELEALGR